MKLVVTFFCIFLTLCHINATTIQTSSTQLDAPRRIVAMGDLHGDLENTKKILRLSGLVDENDHWSGGDTVYVQTGDVVDRGKDTIALYELIQRLRDEAPEQGGLVIPLLGNHEIMNLAGDWRYVSKEDIETFGGYSKRVEAFKRDGFIGEYLVQLNMTTKVGSTVFCHGGIHPNFARLGLDTINDYTHHDLVNYMSTGGQADPHKIFGDKGPTWYRGYALADEPDICRIADKSLAYMKADRMVMGHTVQRDGKIRTRCNGKLILVDIGISWVYGGYVGALEIVGDELTAIYENGRVPLTPPKAFSGAHEEL